MAVQGLSRLRALDATRVGTAIAALLLGGSLVLFVGFSHIDSVHNSAHDTRHSAGFPCH